jgi:hypothetical protein
MNLMMLSLAGVVDQPSFAPEALPDRLQPYIGDTRYLKQSRPFYSYGPIQ